MAGFSVILPALDAIRSLGSVFGVRSYQVYITVTSWTGERAGIGTKASTTTQIVNTDLSGTAWPVQVVELSRKEVILSGGQFSDQMLKVGPFTPNYTGGGFTDGVVDPVTNAGTTEVNWLVTGRGLPPSGAYFDKVGEEATAFHYYVTLKRSARAI